MKKTIAALGWLVALPVLAQDRPVAAPPAATTTSAAAVKFPTDTVTRREAVATIKGQRVPYGKRGHPRLHRAHHAEARPTGQAVAGC